MNLVASWVHGGILALFLGAPATVAPPMEPVEPPEGAPGPSGVERGADAPSADPFPSRTYGNLDDEGCLAALDQRNIPYERYERRARGVKTPVRLLGALHGVKFIHADIPDWLTSARREILDCRLVLALDDLASLASRHGVASVVHYGVYRGDLPLPKTGRPLHHVAALAIDVAAFVKEDGTRLDVKRDWPGRVGGATCEGKPAPAKDDQSDELYGVLCDVARERLFHQVLTPNHDSRHKDHFHLEVMRGTSWTLVQ
jgi:hypothetical protein